MMIRIIYLSLLVMAFSCATVGENFDFKGIDSLKIGQTNRNDIVRVYGEPFRVGYNNGRLVWTYGLYKYRLFGATDTKDLQITFDEKGVVSDYTYYTSVKGEKEKLMLRTYE